MQEWMLMISQWYWSGKHLIQLSFMGPRITVTQHTTNYFSTSLRKKGKINQLWPLNRLHKSFMYLSQKNKLHIFTSKIRNAWKVLTPTFWGENRNHPLGQLLLSQMRKWLNVLVILECYRDPYFCLEVVIKVSTNFPFLK